MTASRSSAFPGTTRYLVPSRGGLDLMQVDLSSYGQVVGSLTTVGDRHDGFDAIEHLAAILAPGIRSDVATFHNNLPVTFNVLWAAVRLGIRRIAYASSETVPGLPFDVPPPYATVDEEYRRGLRASTRS
jgi:nucleoside-diphosphate-sugar epimerase